MGMADLKRTSCKPDKVKAVDVDTFIEDADRYALGLPSLAEEGKPQTNQSETESQRKNATFSLTGQVIEELSSQSGQLGLSKSALVRTLIRYFAGASEIEQRRLLSQLPKDKK